MTSPVRPENIQLGLLSTSLPAEGADADARALHAQGKPWSDVARQVPSSSLAWASLAEQALGADDVAAYAYARTGYHRGLDALRQAGWRGVGLVPAEHVPNQGFLRALLALTQASHAIGELDEVARCERFLADCGATAETVQALR